MTDAEDRPAIDPEWLQKVFKVHAEATVLDHLLRVKYGKESEKAAVDAITTVLAAFDVIGRQIGRQIGADFLVTVRNPVDGLEITLGAEGSQK